MALGSGAQPRWLGGAAAAWALLLACGVCRFPGPVWSRRAMLVTVVALSGFFALAWLRYPGDGLPQAFAYWRAHASPEDKVFLVHRGYLEHAMEIEGSPAAAGAAAFRRGARRHRPRAGATPSGVCRRQRAGLGSALSRPAKGNRGRSPGPAPAGLAGWTRFIFVPRFRFTGSHRLRSEPSH